MQPLKINGGTCMHILREMTHKRSGSDHLVHASRLKIRLSALLPIANILIIDDTVLDAEVLSSTLRLIVGHDVRLRHVRYQRDIRAALNEEPPTVIFLDDRLGHGTSAEVSLNQIRSTGCKVPVIVLSGMLTRARQIELMKLGVADIVHKDDINGARISEAILKALEKPAHI